MAIGVYFAPAIPADKYNECVRLLRKVGAGHPTGRSYHATFGDKEKLAVFDVWTSQAAFDKFGRTLMPILQQLGVDPGTVNVMPIHNVIMPARKAVAKKSPPNKRGKTAARRK